ncbi:MAG: molybdopterin-guanine dinucleotide biosynthesis protein MobA [Gammaproteobacteria bacterium]|nr:MAG: molybdopterin-guanine dinucleotide biosynthesis protein MobA [Gammaproteobacteria bacterium]
MPSNKQQIIGALVLAGGLSERFKSNKLLHPLPDGTPLVLETLSQLIGAKIPIHVITHPRQTLLCKQLDTQQVPRQQLTYSYTDSTQVGIGYSIAQGVQATTHWHGWLICLADMPYIQSSTYQQIAQQLQHSPLVKPYYQKQGGNPVGFGSQYRELLMNLQGDQGARNIIQQHEYFRLDVDDPGILMDIDRPEDIQHPGL